MKYLIILITTLLFTACSIKQETTFTNIQSKLVNDLRNLSSKIDIKEAEDLATTAITYSKTLADEYEINSSALIHNTLINLDFKTKGFCYDFTTDLLKKLKEQKYKTINLLWAVHKKGQYWEHNAIVVTHKNQSFEDGIILDAWRDSGDLFFSKVKDDKSYTWSEDIRKSEFYGNKLKF